MSPRISLKALASAGVLAASAAIPALGAAPAQAAPHVVTKPVVYPDGAVELPIKPRVQQQSNWCWAATGSTIAEYKGKNVTQNAFCNLAFGRSQYSSCPNDQATLENDQRAYRSLGIRPGYYSYSPLSMSRLTTEIKADRPVLTRIGWSSGGGHMMVINGVSPSTGEVEWYDPWPSDQRINVADYDYYVDNYDFSWTHSLYGIGA